MSKKSIKSNKNRTALDGKVEYFLRKFDKRALTDLVVGLVLVWTRVWAVHGRDTGAAAL